MKKSNASENDSKSRLDFLYEEIVKHNKKYHQENNPSISDAEYDDLVREALEIEKKFHIITRAKRTLFITIYNFYMVLYFKKLSLFR